VDRKDVRVIESGGELDFSQETLGAERVSQLGVKDLERNVTFVPEVLRQVHRRHSATPKLALDAVPIREAAPELLG
jgi:hypothetical protein